MPKTTISKPRALVWGVFIATVGSPGYDGPPASRQITPWFPELDSCGGGNGCIGWKQFAEDGPLSVSHTWIMVVNSARNRRKLATAITYWTVPGRGQLHVPVGDCTPQSYPTVRVVPYDNNAGATGYWAVEWTYDQNPGTSAFSACWQSCSLGTGGNAQKGYDLSEVLLNTYYSPSWTWVSKHELGHTLGLDDHSCGYSGLMDSDACTQVNATNAELDEVDTIHDH